MSQTVIGIFKNPAQAQEAKSYLLANGFINQNIDVSNHNNQSEYGTNQMNENTIEEGVGDRISNFFKNLFTDENDASSHITAARTGTIVTVHADTSAEASHAAEALNEYGAIDVNDMDANHSNNPLTNRNNETDYTEKFNVNETRSTEKFNVNETGSSDKINVIKEELQVGKQMVETGGVRLRSRIVERPVEQSIRLREEHVNVERNVVDRPATDADFANFKEGTIELTENTEKPIVSKNARVVEEVSLGKEVTERDETIKDTVRHTEVDTENINAENNRKDKI